MSLTAALLGALLGAERERAGKPAGLRTHMLVALGAALFVLFPAESGMEVAELGMPNQGVATGIGFIGAGTILKRADAEQVEGLTTAASIWLTGAIGMSVGAGQLWLSVVCAIFRVGDLVLFLPPGNGIRRQSRRSATARRTQLATPAGLLLSTRPCRTRLTTTGNERTTKNTKTKPIFDGFRVNLRARTLFYSLQKGLSPGFPAAGTRFVSLRIPHRRARGGGSPPCRSCLRGTRTRRSSR